MLPSTSLREVFLACPSSSPWNLPFFNVESCPCSRFDLLFLAKVRLWPILTLSPFMIWYSGLTTLFLFLLAKAALAYLPTALSVASRPLFPSQQAQYVQVFLLKQRHSARSLLVSAAPTSLLLFFSSYLTLVLSSSPCPLLHLSSYLKSCGRSGSNCFLSPPVLTGYNGSPDIRFSWGTMRLMRWPDGERYSCPLQSHVVFFSYLSYPILSFFGLEA